MTKFWTNTSCATWGPNLQLMLVVLPCGQICASSSIWWPKCGNNGWCIIWWQHFLLANGRWHHLVAKFATNSSGPKSDWTFLEIRKWWFDRNTNLIFGNTAHLKWRNIWTCQSRFNSQREQTLSTCVLILISSWRGWTCSCTPMTTPSSGTWSTFLFQYDFIHPQAEIQSGETCPQASPTPQSWLWSLDVNFINPYKTADFLFFDGKEDAKKTDNSVVKVKGCLIDAHVDINNLPPFPSDHQILIVLQCLMISWEKLIMEKII